MDDYKYLSIQQIVERESYPFSSGQIRHFLCHRHRNGLEKAVRKIGKRLYMREDLWVQWIEEQSYKRG